MLKECNIRCSVVGLAAEVSICKTIAKETAGEYNVSLDESHFKDILMSHIAPPPVSVSQPPIHNESSNLVLRNVLTLTSWRGTRDKIDKFFWFFLLQGNSDSFLIRMGKGVFFSVTLLHFLSEEIFFIFSSKIPVPGFPQQRTVDRLDEFSFLHVVSLDSSCS